MTDFIPDSFRIDVDPSLTATAQAQHIGPFTIDCINSSPMPKESIFDFPAKLNAFLHSANVAFDKHLGFVLAPQQIFVLILQSVAMHVNQNAEALRPEFVKHSGKESITIEVTPNPTETEWEAIIDRFQAAIASKTIEDTAELTSLIDFSCATKTEQIAGNVCLMDMVQQYFRYTMMTMCGIPYFILEGSMEDWVLLRERAERLISQKTLPTFASAWLPALLPTLDKIVEQRSGAPVDIAFWNSFFKRGATKGSGAFSYISGWVNVFFPIAIRGGLNYHCKPFSDQELYIAEIQQKDCKGTGLDVNYFPSGVSSAPVEWVRLDLGTTQQVEFKSGFITGTFKEGHIRPEVAWWVTATPSSKSEK